MGLQLKPNGPKVQPWHQKCQQQSGQHRHTKRRKPVANKQHPRVKHMSPRCKVKHSRWCKCTRSNAATTDTTRAWRPPLTTARRTATAATARAWQLMDDQKLKERVGRALPWRALLRPATHCWQAFTVHSGGDAGRWICSQRSSVEIEKMGRCIN